MSFHSTQATSQALQPMQVVVSMSLQTSGWRCTPLPGVGPGWAEICWIWSVFRSAISASLCFLELHQEALEFRRVSVGIDDRRSEKIGRRFGGFSLVFLDAQEAEVNRNSYLIGLLAINHHWLDALGHHVQCY